MHVCARIDKRVCACGHRSVHMRAHMGVCMSDSVCAYGHVYESFCVCMWRVILCVHMGVCMSGSVCAYARAHRRKLVRAYPCRICNNVETYLQK